jgi:UDP-N-acetylglucosamine 4,6-dehydratase
MMQGGEIFVPKIPSTYITDLADVIAPKAKKKVVGIRPGEKLHEVLLTEDESRHAKEYDRFFVIEPEHACWAAHWGHTHYPDGKNLPEGFRYTSENNDLWLSKDELRKIVKKAE